MSARSTRRSTANAAAESNVITSLKPIDCLLLAQAVWELGASSWSAVAKLLTKHPLLSHPKSFFTPQLCMAIYNHLMKEAGLECTEGADAVHAASHLKLAQKHYGIRVLELRDLIAAEEAKFKTLVSEIDAIRSGLWDGKIKARLSGEPEPEDHQSAAAEDGSAELEEDVDIAQPEAEASEEIPPAEEQAPLEHSSEHVEQALESPQREDETIDLTIEDAQQPDDAPVVIEVLDDEDPSIPTGETDPPDAAECSTSMPVDLTSEAAVDAEIQPTPDVGTDVKNEDDNDSDATLDDEPTQEDMNVDVQADIEAAESDTEALLQPDPEKEDEKAANSREASDDQDLAASSAPPRSSSAVPSPASPSVVQDAPETQRSPSRDASESRAMDVDEDVQHPMTPETEPHEPVKMEEETDEVPSPLPQEGTFSRRREGKRKASLIDGGDTRERKRARDESEPLDEDEQGSTPGPTRRGSKRQDGAVVSKKFQSVISMLHSQISQHRNGTIFHNPIKPSEAPDYHDIVKRPMDLKTIKMRIKDGMITTSREFQRDIYLMFANAMMYNRPGSDIFAMTEDMMLESEDQINSFRQTEGYVRGTQGHRI